MTIGFVIKNIIAKVYHILGISNLKLHKLNKKYNSSYIRAVNYHHVLNESSFRHQLKYYKKNYDNINYNQFVQFIEEGTLPGNKPGIMLTFDDGYEDNYTVALSCLEENGFTGWFMVSSDLIGTNGYMDTNQLKNLISRSHVIGDHTATHHRMNIDDTEQVMKYEIIESKQKLEKMLDANISIFCWCGGEEKHYTQKAAREIRNAGYKYGFMTNSYPVLKGADPFQIQRINVEDAWPLSLVKLQICGFMDKRFKNKRERVETIIK